MSKPDQCLPATHRTSHVFIDESGLARQSRVLAIGALKFRSGHGPCFTELEQFRCRSGWRKEAHFVDVARLNLHHYREAIRILAASDARFTCAVVDCDKGDPFDKPNAVPWKVHAQLTIALLNRVISGSEIVSVTLDHFTVPGEANYEAYVRSAVNRQKGRLAVATICRMDSKACWGIQMADILTGAVGHQHRQLHDPRVKAGSAKGTLASFVADQFNVATLLDADTPRLRVIQHMGRRDRRSTQLRVVDTSTRSAS